MAARSTPLEGETILQAAERDGTVIPRLCYTPGYRPDGNCRACVVEIDGERTLAPSCCRAPTPGMKVQVDQRTRAEEPEDGRRDAAVRHAGAGLQVGRTTTPPARMASCPNGRRALGVTVRPALKALTREQPPCDLSHPAMAVNLDACIQCNRCVRACREEQVNDVIGYAFRGGHSAIVFDLADGMGDSTCVACGECVQACPTGALMPKTQIGSQVVDKKVDSVCPFCGVGCLLTYNVKGNEIVSVDGRDGPANHNRLCVKGRFGFDYVHHPQRLTKPLIRKAGVPKNSEEVGDPSKWRDVFREATWEEALDLTAGEAQGPARHARTQGPGRLRLGQGQQRGGLPLPEAGAHRLRQQQRRPLHAPVPRLERGGAAGRRGLGGRLQPGQRRRARRT